MNPSILIIGASARAAAFSALRAGLAPWCADLFADCDLRNCCPVERIAAADYPRGFVDFIANGRNGLPNSAWLYTGALENHWLLVSRWASRRGLWGNDAKTLGHSRLPEWWSKLLQEAGVPCPRIRGGHQPLPVFRRSGQWLVKPLRGASGVGIRAWQGEPLALQRVFLQEFIEGEPCSAIYVGERRQARLLGVTRQLIGEAWLHAGPFRYCGSIGPMPLADELRQRFETLGQTLAKGCDLRGLFGVDCVLRHAVPYPVEINPRYTASVEILEHATGMAALALHRAVFDGAFQGLAALASPDPVTDQVGKAILFARKDLIFPQDGPWLRALEIRDPWKMPPFADIPAAGTPIRRGQPILTMLTRAASAAACQEELQRTASELDRILFGE